MTYVLKVDAPFRQAIKEATQAVGRRAPNRIRIGALALRGHGRAQQGRWLGPY
jgi:hypothetical protein